MRLGGQPRASGSGRLTFPFGASPDTGCPVLLGCSEEDPPLLFRNPARDSLGDFVAWRKIVESVRAAGETVSKLPGKTFRCLLVRAKVESVSLGCLASFRHGQRLPSISPESCRRGSLLAVVALNYC